MSNYGQYGDHHTRYRVPRHSAIPKELMAKDSLGSSLGSSLQSDEGIGRSLPSFEDHSATDSDSMNDKTRHEVCKMEGYSCDDGLVQKTKNISLSDKRVHQLQAEDQSQSITSTDSGYDSLQRHSYTSDSFKEQPKPSFMHSYAQTNDIRYLLAANWKFLVVGDEDGDNCLHSAIINCQTMVTLAIIDVLPSKEYLNIRNDLAQTPLHLAVITQQPKIVEKLLDNGASVDLPDRNGQNCLHLACKYGDLKAIRAIFKRRENNMEYGRKLQDILEARNFEGRTPLHVAVSEDKPDVVQLLLSLGAYVDATASKSGYSPLHLAVEQNNLLLVSFLLFQGNANVNAMSYADCTPLHLAAGLGFTSIMATLIAAGADQTLTTFEGETAYDISCDDVQGLLDCSYSSMEDESN